VDAGRARAERSLALAAVRPPVDLFASVGLDVTTPEPIERAFDVVEGYVTRLEELAG
jgi:oligoendopeptidase F